MPTFFQALKRLIAGKPVFDANDRPLVERKAHEMPVTDVPVVPAALAQRQSLIRKGDTRTFPVVEVVRTVTHEQGSHMRVYCHIKNHWPAEVYLDKIRLLNTTKELDDSLGKGEELEMEVYEGPKLQRPGPYQAYLEYKTKEEGDYFQAMHDLKFTYHSAGGYYTVESLRLHLPVRDIYG